MGALRRATLAVAVAGAVASFVRLVVRKPDSPPPAAGGEWRPLTGSGLN